MKKIFHKIRIFKLLDLYKVIQWDEISDIEVSKEVFNEIKFSILRIEDNPLSNQINLELDSLNLEINNLKTLNHIDVIIHVDFEGSFDTSINIDFQKFIDHFFTYGFYIIDDGNRKHYCSFEKSNGMSRVSVISFILNDTFESYNGKSFKEVITNRILLDIKVEEANISKFYAYKGLMLSNGIKINNIDLNENNFVIVPDVIDKRKMNVVTGDNFDDYVNKIKRYYKFSLYWVKKPHHYDTYFTNTDEYNKEILEKLNICFYESGLNNFKSINEIQAIDILFHNDQFSNTLFYYIRRLKLEILDEIWKYINDVWNVFNIDEKNNIIKKKEFINILNEFDNEKLNLKISELNHFFDNPIESYIDGYRVWKRIEKEKSIEINLFDGEGICSLEFAKKLSACLQQKSNKRNHFSFQFRLPFMKGMLHAVDFKKFYQSKNVTYIYDIFNQKHNISEIDVIITLSQFKGYKWLLEYFDKKSDLKSGYYSPMKYYWDKFNHYNHKMFLSGYDNFLINKIPLVKLNYQFLHTPSLMYQEFKNLLDFNEEIITKKSMKNVIENFYLKEEFNSEEIVIDDLESYNEQDYIKGLSIIKNPLLILDKSIQNDLRDINNKHIYNFSLARLFTTGEQRFLSSDLLLFLYSIHTDIKIKMPSEEILHLDRFYMPASKKGLKLEYKKKYAIMRNPHLTRNESVLLKPFKYNNSERTMYFYHLKGVIMLNPYSLNAERLGGADYDGDLIKIFDDQNIVNAVKRNFMHENPIILIPHAEAKKEIINKQNELKNIKKTFSSRVGYINFLAFDYSIDAYNDNSIESKGKDVKTVELLSIINGLEIDSQKNGEKPYIPPAIQKTKSNLFLRYKKAVLKNLEYKKKYTITKKSPNLYHLIPWIKSINYELKKTKRNINIKLKMKQEEHSLKIFTFEKNIDWKKNISLKEKTSLAFAYFIRNAIIQSLYFSKKTTNIESMNYNNIIMIIQNQYGSSKVPIVNQILSIFNGFSKDELKYFYDELIIKDWKFVINSNLRIKIISEVIGDYFDDDELSILINFKEFGYRLIFMFIIESMYQSKNNDESINLDVKKMKIDYMIQRLTKYLNYIRFSEFNNLDKEILDYFELKILYVRHELADKKKQLKLYFEINNIFKLDYLSKKIEFNEHNPYYKNIMDVKLFNKIYLISNNDQRVYVLKQLFSIDKEYYKIYNIYNRVDGKLLSDYENSYKSIIKNHPIEMYNLYTPNEMRDELNHVIIEYLRSNFERNEFFEAKLIQTFRIMNKFGIDENQKMVWDLLYDHIFNNLENHANLWSEIDAE